MNKQDFRFVRVERDCPQNRMVRDGRQGRILYDFEVLYEGKKVGEFRRQHFGKRGYTLLNNQGQPVKIVSGPISRSVYARTQAAMRNAAAGTLSDKIATGIAQQLGIAS